MIIVLFVVLAIALAASVVSLGREMRIRKVFQLGAIFLAVME